MTATPTTTDLDTELSAVNTILGSIGQSPVTAISNTNPEISYVYNLLKESNIDIQSEGWTFNTEKHVEFVPDSDKYIKVPADVIQMDWHAETTNRAKDVVKRNGRMYDKVKHTDKWDEKQNFDVTYLYSFTDIPQVFRRYIIYAAATRAATQLVGNPNLAQLLQQKEVLARANCIEYECNQADYTFFSQPDDTVYNSYKPYNALRR